MIQTTLKTRLGKRLKALLACVPEDCSEFYDLCCDHGALGRAVLETRPQCKVVFNDIHPGIMSRLESDLVRLNAVNYSLDVGPAENLRIQPGHRPVIMLAGIGDEQTIVILQQLFAQPASRNALFIVSPATKVFYVRKFLRENQIKVQSELICSENKRSYEVLIIDRQRSDECYANEHERLFGNQWSDDSIQRKHLEKLVAFYQAKHRNQPSTEIQFIVDGYQKVLKNLKKIP